MKNKYFKLVSIVLILIITIVSIYINFDLDMKASEKYTFTTFIYLVSWIIFISIGIKYKCNQMLSLNLIFWIITLITSILMYIGNITSYIPDAFEIFTALLVLLFATPLKGIAFSSNVIVNIIIFLITSIIFITTPYVYKLLFSKEK